MPISPAEFVTPTDTSKSAAHSGDNNAWYQYHSLRQVNELTAASQANGIAAAKRDIDFIVTAMGLQPSDRLLEVGCGWGRHTLILQERGFRNLTSVDIAPAMLTVARERAATTNCAADLRECDFRDLSAEPSFDAILSLYDRSCCGFASEAEDRQSLDTLHKMLRPGGLLFFGIGDWPVALPTARRDWREWGGVVELLETIPAAAAMTCTDRTTVLVPAGRQVYTLTRRHYSLPELRHLLHDADFAIEQAWHAFDAARPYGAEHEGLFVLTRRGAA
jgi:ubiquinone/menaquinone biosynthesis C-methylase UbiE